MATRVSVNDSNYRTKETKTRCRGQRCVRLRSLVNVFPILFHERASSAKGKLSYQTLHTLDLMIVVRCVAKLSCLLLIGKLVMMG
jgi:hypothetical protein